MITIARTSPLLKLSLSGFTFFASAIAIAQAKEEVVIDLRPSVAGQPFECGKNYADIGQPPQTITPTDWRMFISSVSLRNAQGQWISLELNADGIWQDGQVVLIDFENGKGPCRNGTVGTNTAIKGRLPPNRYNAVKFRIGVPFEYNHKDPTRANPPLSTTAMFWNWQGGYKFIKFDATTYTGASTNSAIASAFSFHLGSTLCSSTSTTVAPQSECQRPNSVWVELIGEDARHTPIVFDIAPVLRETDLSTNTPQTPPGCMSTHTDPDCAAIFRMLKLPADTRMAHQFDFVRWGQ